MSKKGRTQLHISDNISSKNESGIQIKRAEPDRSNKYQQNVPSQNYKFPQMTGYHWNHGCTMLQGTRKKINNLRSQKKIQLVQFRSIKEKKAKQKKNLFYHQ